jgi:RNA-directed DNA polymerase
MFNSAEKFSNMFMFSFNCFSVINDVLLRELRLKQVGIIYSHALYNQIIKRLTNSFVGKMLKSSYLFEVALTLDWDYDGFPLSLKRLYAQNTISQMIALINRIREIAYRSTEKKTLACNATIKFKLGKSVRIYNNINFLNLVRSLYLNKVFFRQLKGAVAGGKIETKVSLPSQANPNFRAYRSGRILLAFELSLHLTSNRCFTTHIDNKSTYIDKSLTKDIKSQFNSKQWITIKQKKLLIKYIENCQIHLSALSINKDSSKRIFYFMELLLNSLLFQVYAVEILSANKGSKSAGIDGKVLKTTSESKLEFLQELKNFRNRKPLPLKRVYTSKENGEKRPISIPSITDCLVQQLFVLVLDPLIEANSDVHSYGFRKGRSPVMAIGDIQKNLQSKLRKGSRNLEPVFIWDAVIKKCFDSINHYWLLKNAPFPPKYKYILKNWLKLGHIEFETNVELTNDTGILQGGIISPLLMNFTLNGMEDLINNEIVKYQKVVPRSRLKGSSKDETKLHFFHKLSDGNFKERQISCRFFRYAEDFIIICSSSRLLSSIQIITKEFLQQRGLEIHSNKSRTFLLKINQPCDFLGYTFVYFIRTKSIRNKLLHRNKKPEYRLHGRPRLSVHPSKSAIKSFKSRLKKLLKQNQNISAYRLIALLNPRIRGWTNYYSFSNAHGVLSSLRNWIYRRLSIWMKRKHPKSSRTWLNKHYFLMENLSKEHDLENNPEVIEYISKITSMKQVQQNKWNFYGITRKSAEGYTYKIPRINVMLWPTSIKEVAVATAFVPKKNLLTCSYYLNQNKWLKEREKLEFLHQNKENKLFSPLWKKDSGLCYLCKTSLADELASFENNTEIHHIISFAEGGSNQKFNLALTHKSCHKNWHQEYSIQASNKKENCTKNRQKFK